MKKSRLLCAMCAYRLIAFQPVNAASLVLSASDPFLDQFGSSPDLIQMNFVFDNATGDYVIDLETTDTNPFVGDFRININLFNLDVGTTANNPSFFNETSNDFSLSGSTTTLTLTGNNARLIAWDAGDRILLNNFPSATPHPDSVSFFRSGVFGLPLMGPFVNEDMLGIESQIDVVSAVPVPAAVWLFGSGLLGLIYIARKKAV